jgi:multiple sugar transport system permease protein
MTKRSKFLRNLGMFALTIPVLLFIYLPVSWLLISSTSTRNELLTVPLVWIPKNPSIQNYVDIIAPGLEASEAAQTFRVTLRNSLFVASSVTLISLLFGSLAAYALVRIVFPLRKALMFGILGTRMIPEISLVIPLYA